jgi:hypothetical protein
MRRIAGHSVVMRITIAGIRIRISAGAGGYRKTDKLLAGLIGLPDAQRRRLRRVKGKYKTENRQS